MILRRRGRRLERRADCEGIKFVTGELRREWHMEERFLCGRGRKNNYRARLIDRPGYRLFFLFLNNIDDIAEARLRQTSRACNRELATRLCSFRADFEST